MRLFLVSVFVDTTGDVVQYPVTAASALEARRQFLREMTKAESIVKIEEVDERRDIPTSQS